MNRKIKISLVDDHTLFRNAVSKVIQFDDRFEVVLEAGDGQDFINKIEPLSKEELPEIVFLDINMPVLDGIKTVEWLKKNQPIIKIIILSMYSNHDMVSKLVKMGVNAFLTKNVEVDEIKKAIFSIYKDGFYYSKFVAECLRQSLLESNWQGITLDKDKEVKELWDQLSERQREFVELACSELTYSDIAERMKVSTKTIDGYRDLLFFNFGVKTRVGLVLLAIRNNLVDISKLA